MNNDQNNQHFDPQGTNNSFYTQPGYSPPIADPQGDSSQTLGIVALVCLFFCQIVSIVCGAMAIGRAKESRALLGFETQASKVGRICGILALVFGILSVVAVLFYIACWLIIVFIGLASPSALFIPY